MCLFNTKFFNTFIQNPYASRIFIQTTHITLYNLLRSLKMIFSVPILIGEYLAQILIDKSSLSARCTIYLHMTSTCLCFGEAQTSCLWHRTVYAPLLICSAGGSKQEATTRNNSNNNNKNNNKHRDHHQHLQHEDQESNITR